MVQKKFSIGQKVWLKHDKQIAVVSDNADNDIIYVITDNMEIPVFAEDVDTEIPVSAITEEEIKNTPVEDLDVKLVEGNPEAKIIFEPIYDGEEIREFKVSFINGLQSIEKVKYSFYERGDLFFTHTFSAAKNEIVFLHTLEFDQLNESPEMDLQIKWGGKLIQKNFRIKPKNFFNKLAFVQQLNSEAYVFVFDLVATQKPERYNQKFEIDTARLKHSMQGRTDKDKNALQHQQAERVVDIHIEKIVKEFKKLSNNEIIEIQLSYFQRALNAALRSHLDHMYVIHGLGKGVLKNRVFEILKTYPVIKEFKNEYHPRYGWGATEIIFK